MKTYQQLCDLTGRWAVITGSSGNLGTVFSNTLIELGCNLVLVDRHQDELEESAENLKKLSNVEVETFQCDLESENERDGLIEYLNQMNRLDILINNAAFGGITELDGWVVDVNNQSLETWRRAIEVNLTAIFHLTKSLSEKMSENGNGSVINISSIYGFLGPDYRLYEGTTMGNPLAYGASKSGLIQLTKYFATAYAPEIRVNSISPGGVERGQEASFIKKYIDRTPMKRMAKGEDLKGVIGFLATDLSSYVTGENIIVDGGFHTW